MTTWYIHPLGNDAGAGTIGDPLRTCEGAGNKSGTGHTYLLAAGMVHEPNAGELFGIWSKANSTFGTYLAADSIDDRPVIDSLVWVGNPSSPYWTGWTYEGDNVWSRVIGVGTNDIPKRFWAGSQVLGGGAGIYRSQRILGVAQGRAYDQSATLNSQVCWTTVAEVKAAINSSRIWYSSDNTFGDVSKRWAIFVRAGSNPAVQPPEYFGGMAFMIPVPIGAGNVGSVQFGLRYRNSATPLIWRDIDIRGTYTAAIGASNFSSTAGVDGMDLRNFDVDAWLYRALHFNNLNTDANRVAPIKNTVVRNVTMRTLTSALEVDDNVSGFIFHGNEAVEVSNGVAGWSGARLYVYGAGHGAFSLQSANARADNTGNTDPAPQCQDVVLEDSAAYYEPYERDARGISTGGQRQLLRNVEIHGQSTGSQLHGICTLENVRWYGCVTGLESGSGGECPVRANPFAYNATTNLFVQGPESVTLNGCLIESVDTGHTSLFMMRVASATNSVGAGVINIRNTLFIQAGEGPYLSRQVVAGTYSTAQSITGCAVVSPAGAATIDDNGSTVNDVNGALGATGNLRYTTAAAKIDSDGRPLPSSPLVGAGVHSTYKRDADGRQRPNPPSIGPFDLPTQRRVLDSDPAEW